MTNRLEHRATSRFHWTVWFSRSVLAMFAGLTGLQVQAEVIISDIRMFEVDQQTEYTKDGKPITAKFFQQVGTGKSAAFKVGPDVDPAMTSGTLRSIDLLTELQGPVTSLHPAHDLSPTCFCDRWHPHQRRSGTELTELDGGRRH